MTGPQQNLLLLARGHQLTTGHPCSVRKAAELAGVHESTAGVWSRCLERAGEIARYGDGCLPKFDWCAGLR